MTGRHYHPNLSAGAPLPMRDIGDEGGYHVHVSAMSSDRFSVVLHDHTGHEPRRILVGPERLDETIADLAAEAIPPRMPTL